MALSIYDYFHRRIEIVDNVLRDWELIIALNVQ